MAKLTFQERLEVAVKIVGSPENLADRAEMSKASIHNYLSGLTDPKVEVVTRLATAAGLSPAWLAYEVGDKMGNSINAVAPSVATSEFPAVMPFAEPRPGYVYLPLKAVEAAAGSGALIDGERVVDVLAFKEDWIRNELHARPADLDLIYVKGDSMEPDLRAGDIILIDHTDTQAKSEGVYVCQLNFALIVKQLQQLPGMIINVISKNPAHKPFTVMLAEEAQKPDGFRVIGRVVWACRRF